MHALVVSVGLNDKNDSLESIQNIVNKSKTNLHGNVLNIINQSLQSNYVIMTYV